MIGFGVSAAGVAADTFTTWQNSGQVLAGLAIVALPLLMRGRPKALKWVVVLLGVTALFFGTYGFLGGTGRQDSPLAFLDSWAPLGRAGALSNSLLIAIALWGLASAFLGPQTPAAGVAPETPDPPASRS